MDKKPCAMQQNFISNAPFTLSTIIGRRNNVDLFCRFIIARHNKKTKEFSEILSVSHALPHRGQYPQSEYGRHLQFVQAVGKNAQANCVCSGAHCAAVGGFAALRMRRPLYGE